MREFSFGNPFPTKADVVFMGALIHWVFTCTANFGKFDPIIEYLLTAADNVLLIEWVDPMDIQIQTFHHLDCGGTKEEEYTLVGFEKALNKVGTIEG